MNDKYVSLIYVIIFIFDIYATYTFSYPLARVMCLISAFVLGVNFGYWAYKFEIRKMRQEIEDKISN